MSTKKLSYRRYPLRYNAIAPLYDAGVLCFEQATVSFVEPISKRSRHAKQAVLFVELKAKLNL